MARNENGVSVPVVGASSDDFQAFTGYSPERVKVRIQFVTWEQAVKWLPGAEKENRKKRQRRVETIATDMFGKKYAFTGVPLLFDEDDTCFDGHHRLASSVRSKTGFWAMVVTGVDRSQAMPAVDDVAIRKHGDRLRIIYGCENYNAAASISLLIWQFLSKRTSSWAHPSFAEIRKVYEKYRDDIDWVMGAIGTKIEPGISSGGAPVFAPFVFVRSLNRSAIDAAAMTFKSGDDMKENDPMRKLRQKISAEGGLRQKVGNKNSASQFSRFAMALYTLECLERVLTKKNPTKNPKADPAVLDRFAERFKTSPTAIKLPRARALPPEESAEANGHG